MKKSMVLSTALLTAVTLASTTLGAVSAADVAPAPAKSFISASFEANTTDPTTPVDPTDPSKPVDPTTPIDPVDPGEDGNGNTGTGNTGALTVDYVSNLVFGTQKIKDAAYHPTNTNPHVQVTDKRGTGEGWNLTAKLNEFKGGSDVAAGAALTFKSGEVKSASTTTAPISPATVVLNAGADSSSMMSAAKDAGKGTWVDLFKDENISFTVPAGNVKSGVEYKATVDWTLTATPKA